MSNFDLDDPLGDLLSDGSDDSFFQDPKPAAKRSSISKSPEKKSVSDLFGLEDKPAESKSDDWLGLGATTPKKVETATTSRREEKVQKKISFEDDNDILNTLGLDSSKTKQDAKKTDAAKKSSLMESIMGPAKEDKKFLSLDDLLKDSKVSKKSDVPAEVSQSTSQLSQKPETPAPYGLSSLDVAREGRRSRSRSAIADPLGLFSSEAGVKDRESSTEGKSRRGDPSPQKETAKEIETEVLFQAKEQKSKSSTNVSEVPDWLGGTTTKHKPDVHAEKSETNLPLSKPQEVQDTIANQHVETLLTQQKLATSNLEYQNTSFALQQQESQVLMALQLRKYEESVANLQRQQSDVLIKQEQQFNLLLERQFAKQQMMENNMRLQQERINNHIHLLMSQPPISGRTSSEEVEKLDELRKSGHEDIIKEYEAIIVNLKQKQHDEIFLLEESYKKQISTIEQSMESIENHLKTELDSLTQKSREKLEQVEVMYTDEISKYKKKIEDIYAAHDNEIKQLRENNNRVLEEIKYEYNTTIENIKLSKQAESSAIQETGSYVDKLDKTISLLDVSSRSILNIKEKVETDYGVLNVAREESIRAKQEEIKLMRMALDKSREAADSERAQLMGLVRNLELKLATLSQNSREEQFALQQATSVLTARAAAIEREAEFNRASVEREREQLKTLRETLLAEQEKAMQQITEEKLAVHAEKVRIETSAKLTHNYDSQRAKAEMEAAIQVAKEATEMTDHERENLLRQLRDVETLKRTLVDRDRKISARERELEVALEDTNRRSLAGERALEEARALQANYNERLREIQSQIASLGNREKRLAEEKIALSKERVALHNATRQIRKCGLCALDNIPQLDQDDVSEPVEQDMERFNSTSVADMFRLQLQMSEDQLVHAEERYSNI